MTGKNEPNLAGYYGFLYSVFQSLRFGSFRRDGKGLQGTESEDLGYVLHNLPSLLQDWDPENAEHFRKGLVAFDEAWNTDLSSMLEMALENPTLF